MLIPEEILDGYKLVRQIGIGGFGEVWLCRIEATREWKALKFLPASASRHLEQELEALIRYRSVTARLQCTHLLPIEHVNRDELRGLYYTMPLADGLLEGDPLAPAWRPKTLAALIEERRSAPGWFLPEEILQIMLPVLEAAQRLSDAGVVHRDIKPENLLFVGGQLVLGDISLLGTDEITLSVRGTPGYTPPSWYLESRGNPDMWGVATTFYSLLTGNSPDKVGRGAFLWPPQGEGSVDGTLWRRWHKAVLRATQENPMERFLGFDAIAEALRHGNGGFDLKEHNPSKIATLGIAFLLLVLASIGGWEMFRFWKPNRLLWPEKRVMHATPAPISPQPATSFDQKLAEAKAQFDGVLNKEQKRIIDAYLQSAHSEDLLDLLRKLQKQGDDYLGLRRRNENASGDGIRKTCAEIEAILPAYRKAHTTYVSARNLEWDITSTTTGEKATATLRAQAPSAEDEFKVRKLIEDYQNKELWPDGLNASIENRESEINRAFTKIKDIERELGTYKDEICFTLQEVSGQTESRVEK